jgi:hypothetical protein
MEFKWKFEFAEWSVPLSAQYGTKKAIHETICQTPIKLRKI